MKLLLPLLRQLCRLIWSFSGNVLNVTCLPIISWTELRGFCTMILSFLSFISNFCFFSWDDSLQRSCLSCARHYHFQLVSPLFLQLRWSCTTIWWSRRRRRRWRRRRRRPARTSSSSGRCGKRALCKWK